MPFISFRFSWFRTTDAHSVVSLRYLFAKFLYNEIYKKKMILIFLRVVIILSTWNDRKLIIVKQKLIFNFRNWWRVNWLKFLIVRASCIYDRTVLNMYTKIRNLCAFCIKIVMLRVCTYMFVMRRLIFSSLGKDRSSFFRASKSYMIHVWCNWHVSSHPCQISLFSSNFTGTLFGH